MGMDRECRLLQEQPPHNENVRQRQEVQAEIVEKRSAVILNMRIHRDEGHHVDYDQGPTRLRPKNPHSQPVRPPNGLGGSVDPKPALLGAGDLLLIVFHPTHYIDPIPKGLPCFLG